MFLFGNKHPSYKPLNLGKNNHILTAIDTFSEILFRKKNQKPYKKTFFRHMKISLKIFDNFFPILFSSFWKKSKDFSFAFLKFSQKNDFQKINIRKLIHIVWDMIKKFYNAKILEFPKFLNSWLPIF